MLSSLISPAEASAQSSMTDEEKQEKFSAYAVEARAFYDEGDYGAAIERLQLANMLILDDRIMFNIGTSYEKMDDCVSAMAYYDAALRVSNPTENWPDKIKAKRSELAASCPNYDPTGVTGRISIDSIPSGATVKVDGKEVGKTPFEVIMLPDGRHTFQVGKKGYKVITEKVALGARADLRLDYALEEEEEEEVDLLGPPKDDKKPLPPVEVDDPGKKTLHIPSLTLVGLGVVGLGVGGYINWTQLCSDDCYYVTERAKYDPNSPEFKALTDERQSRVVIMAASTTVGVLLIAGGVTWFVLDRKKQDEQSFMLTPTLSRDGAGVGMHLSF